MYYNNIAKVEALGIEPSTSCKLMRHSTIELDFLSTTIYPPSKLKYKVRSLVNIITQYNLTFKMAVSLVDYDPRNKAREAPDTPRSVEACRRVG